MIRDRLQKADEIKHCVELSKVSTSGRNSAFTQVVN